MYFLIGIHDYKLSAQIIQQEVGKKKKKVKKASERPNTSTLS